MCYSWTVVQRNKQYLNMLSRWLCAIYLALSKEIQGYLACFSWYVKLKSINFTMSSPLNLCKCVAIWQTLVTSILIWTLTCFCRHLPLSKRTVSPGPESQPVYSPGWSDSTRSIKVSANKSFEFIWVNCLWITLNTDSSLEIRINITYILITRASKSLKNHLKFFLWKAFFCENPPLLQLKQCFWLKRNKKKSKELTWSKTYQVHF